MAGLSQCDWCIALPRDTTDLSAVHDCGFPDHTHLLFCYEPENI